MTADNQSEDLEDFIRLQKEKLTRERNGLGADERPRKQWDTSNQDQIIQSVKENIPLRLDTPEVPIAAKLGGYEEKRKRLLEEKKKEYNEMQSRQGGTRRTNRPGDQGGGALPGLRDSQSAKQRKIAERNREYNEFLKSKQGKGRRGRTPNTENGMVFPSEKARPKPERAERPPSRSRGTDPIRRGPKVEVAIPVVPTLDIGGSTDVYGPSYTVADYSAPPARETRDPITGAVKDGGASLPIDDRAAELKRKEEIRNREYNEFLQSQQGKRGRRREVSPSDQIGQRERARSVGAPQIVEPRKGWGTPRYDDILETKRHQEASYRQNAYTMRPAVSDGDLDQMEETRKLDRLDDVFESRKVRFKSELFGQPRRPRVALDDDDWLDFYKSPSRLTAGPGLGLSRAHTTLDSNNFDLRADRIKSAPLRDQPVNQPQAFTTRQPGATTLSREQYRLELEQQMKMNAENRRRARAEEISVNASGLTDITRQNVDLELGRSRNEAARANPSAIPDGNLLSAAGQAQLGPYNSPMDEAYYYYARRDPLDAAADTTQVTSGYVPTVPGPASQRRSFEEPRTNTTRVSFGPATNVAPGLTPRHKSESALVTVAAIPTLTEDDQKGIAKVKTNNYQAELQRQIEENKMRKNIEQEQRRREEAKLEAEISGYNPFGRGGGGAPLKDNQGNVFADLKQMHVSNVSGRPPPPPNVPVTSAAVVSGSVYDNYLSPRKEAALTFTTTPRQTNAFDEPTFARGGHGIFGDPKTEAEKSTADRYKTELQLQIEEKKRREEERKMKQKLEEERELQKIEEARLKMQREYEEEVRKQREKEENMRRRNEELKLQAEEKRREAENLRRQHHDERRLPSRTQHELERERIRLTLSPPIPTLRTSQEYSARRSPPIPTHSKALSPRDNYYNDEPVLTTRLDRAGSADVLSKLEVIRKQLQSERQRVENQLEKDKYNVDVFDPRLVKAAPIAAVPVVMSPPVVLSPVPRHAEVDVFETAALNRAPVTVKRPPADNVNPELLGEFQQYKNRDTDSRQKFRQMFPDQPTTGGTLETQQLALLRHQEEQLNNLKTEPSNLGSKTMLKSESAYIDEDGLPVKPTSPRERRRKKRVQLESPKSTKASTTSLNSEVNKKNESRLKKLRDMNDNDSLQDPDDILDRFMNRQQHNRPNSGTTLNDDEAWLRPSGS